MEIDAGLLEQRRRLGLDRKDESGGGPDAVIEVRSPNDESYEKLPFFAKLGITEVIIIDRDTKRVDVFRLAAGGYERREATADGRLASDTLAVWFETLDDAQPRVRVTAEPGAEALI